MPDLPPDVVEAGARAAERAYDEAGYRPDWPDVVARAVLSAVPLVPRSEVEAELAAFLQEALDETRDVPLPHAYHMLRVKVGSRISALKAGEVPDA